MANQRNEYKDLIDNIESIRMYDGRNKGVDVYTCEKCGKTFLTRYKDKGVTPFTIACKEDDCKGTMVHRNTISEEQAEKEGLIVHNWVRPTLEQFDEFIKQGKTGLIEHLVQGGLVLEEELK